MPFDPVVTSILRFLKTILFTLPSCTATSDDWIITLSAFPEADINVRVSKAPIPSIAAFICMLSV